MTLVTDIKIPKDAKHVVLFVHGFGVRWDSRGMFLDIRESLPNGWGSALFDFYESDDNHTFIKSLKDQVIRLREILEIISREYPDITIHIVAHSMGCIVTSMVSPDISGKVIFLAPPEKFSNRIEEYFKSQPGTKTNDKELVVPRKDGTISHIPIDFFDHLKKLDAEGLVLGFINKRAVDLIQTTKDEVLGETAYSLLRKNPNLRIRSMESDHNFTGKSRGDLLNYINRLFELVYIVDKEDKVIDIKFREDTTPRDRIRIVAAWIENSNGEVIIAQRSHTKRLDPGKWGPSAAGGVEFGESYVEAIKKEVNEELGVDQKYLKEIIQIDKYPYGDDEIEPRMLALFLLKLDWPIDRFKIPKDEVESIKWIPKSELLIDITAKPDRYLPQCNTWVSFLSK